MQQNKQIYVNSKSERFKADVKEQGEANPFIDNPTFYDLPVQKNKEKLSAPFLLQQQRFQ